MCTSLFKLPAEIVGCHVLSFLDYKQLAAVDTAVTNRAKRSILLEAFCSTQVGCYELKHNNLREFILWKTLRKVQVQDLTVNLWSSVVDDNYIGDEHLQEVCELLDEARAVHLRELGGSFSHIAQPLGSSLLRAKIRSANVAYGTDDVASLLLASCQNLSSIIIPPTIQFAQLQAFCTTFTGWERLRAVSLVAGRSATPLFLSLLMEHLQRAVNLEDFSATQCSPSLSGDCFVPMFESCHQLKKVRVEWLPNYTSGSGLTELMVTALARKCSLLKELHVIEATVTYSALRVLCMQCPELEALTVTSITFGQHLLQTLLQHGQRLRALRIPCCLFIPYQSDDLAASMGEARIATEGTRKLECLHNLRQLVVTGNCSDNCAAVAARLCDVACNVDELEMCTGSPISAAVVAALTDSCPNLTSLTVHFARAVTDASIAALATAHPQLLHLRLHAAASLTDAAVIMLGRNCSKLQSLLLECNNSITQDSLVPLLIGCPGLRCVEIQGCAQCGDTTLDAAAYHCSRLKRFALHGTGLRFTSAAVVRLVRECPRLKYCSLSCPPLCDAMLRELELVQIKQGRTVKVLCGLPP
jgi:hypothetical protein